jgi:hypothetical protein
MGIGILHDDIDAHGHAADGARTHQQLAVVGVFRRPQHDHAIAERELGVGDGAALPFVDRVPLEAEGPTEELDRGRRILILQRRDDG